MPPSFHDVPRSFEDYLHSFLRREPPPLLPPYLKKIFEATATAAPKWSIEPTASPVDPARFAKVTQRAIETFPENCDQERTLHTLASFTTHKLTEPSDYPSQAHAGWFLGIMANTFEHHQQGHLITEHVLPAIYQNLTEKNSVTRAPYLFAPALLSVLKAPLDTLALEQTANFASTLPNAEKLSLFLASLTNEDDFGGAFRFPAERKRIFQQITLRHPPVSLAQTIQQARDNQLRVSALTHLLESLPPAEATKVANYLFEDESPAGLATTARNLNRHDYPYLTMDFSTALLHALPEDRREAYASQLLNKAFDRNFQDFSRNNGDRINTAFLRALPPHHAFRMVSTMATHALSARYAVSKNTVSQNEAFCERMRTVRNLHEQVPPELHGIMEDAALRHLRAAAPEQKPAALLSATILLRNVLTEDRATLRTREVDFYRPRQKHRCALAHLKPTGAFNARSTLTVDHFIGSLDQFEARLQPDPSGGPPRYRPPWKQEVFPQEVYSAYLKRVQTADQRHTPSKRLPTLEDLLEQRQQQRGHALPAPKP